MAWPDLYFVVGMPTISQSPLRREIELDFIRGIAILAVLDFHAPNPIFFYPFKLLGFQHFGWAGVNLFFVLSGFLVGGLLIKEWKVRGRIDSKQFLIRRAFKIWPQYYVFIILMLMSGHRTWQWLLGNLLHVQNYAGGVPHTWSLAVEEHAYLLLVLCLGIAAQRRMRMRTLFLSVAGVTVFVLVSRLVLAFNGYHTYDYTHTRIDGILYGVMLAILYHYAPETFRSMQARWWVWLTLLACSLALLRVQNVSEAWLASVSWDCGNVMGIAMLMLLYKHREGSRRPAIYRLVAWIGLYSYGIYLWHVSVLGGIIAIAPRLHGWASVAWLALAPMVLGVLLGVLFTKLVEFPALRLRERLFPRRVDSPVGVPAELEPRVLDTQPA